MPPRALVSNAVWSLNKLSYLNLDQQDQELFCQFQRQTVYSLGSSALVKTYENKLYRDSFTVSLTALDTFPSIFCLSPGLLVSY